ncbi:helix-turn-helix domain-containing protein [Aquimarina macrocephali]|uniref:helix-turn-helix domain-containing protein n=1 Tax=Aquimarina macrocephali TaxID=666563 RepID=UPI00137844CA|nr:helix-turn-helix domain-containing protein [Aquimarina macrocephali]
MDSLKNKTFEELEKGFNHNKKRNDFNLAKLYLSTYLKKAKRLNRKMKVVNAYELYYKINRNKSSSLNYADSIIQLTIEIKDSLYPARGFFLKAAYYYRNGKYDLALDNYLKMDQYAKKNNNLFQQYKVKHSIGLLKNASEEEDQALQLFKEYYDFIKHHKKTHQREYLVSLIALADAYSKMDDYDSAKKIAELGIAESETSGEKLHSSFLLILGIVNHANKNYNEAIDAFKKAEKEQIRNKKYTNLMVTYLHLGKTLKEQGLEGKSIKYLKKTDSIGLEKSLIFQEMRPTYELLIDYYKKNNNKEQQLKYIERLLHVDSVLTKNEKTLSKNILTNYETPQLILEKELIISQLRNKQKRAYILVCIFVIIAISFLIVIYRLYLKHKTYQKRVDKLLHSNVKSTNHNINVKSFQSTDSEKLGISKSVVENVISKLELFEKHHSYLSNDITLISTAKKFKTNSSYLSKIVNSSKNKSFSNYINDLRIDYIIEKLKKDKKIRSYSIKAIGNEIGFNNAESFSKAFYKNTGVYPSFFIKELKKNKQNYGRHS